MARVEIGQYRAQDAHYGFYRDDLPSGDVIIIRRKVGEPTDYLHPNSRKVRQQRLNFGLASTHYSHLTPIQKRELRYVVEELSFVRGHSKSGTKVLQGRTLFISKDIHALNETQKQIPTPLQICIMLTDKDHNPIEGDVRLYYKEGGEWIETPRILLAPSYWLFPTVPRNMEQYHPIGQAEGYHDPEDPDTTYLTQKELMLYHYHVLYEGYLDFQNLGFENYPEAIGAPPYWTPFYFGGRPGTYQRIEDDVKEGSYAAGFTARETASGVGLRQTASAVKYRGRKITFRAWGKGWAYRNNDLTVGVDGTGGWLLHHQLRKYREWEQRTIEGLIPEDATIITIAVRCYTGSKLYESGIWDDITIEG